MRTSLPVLLVSFLSLGAGWRQSPTAKPPPRQNTPPAIVGDPSEGGQDINLPEEMRVKMAIARAEGEHRKVLEDVQKLSDLSTEVSDAFRDHSQLAPDDLKKLSNMDKLAKRILVHAGGSEVDDKSETTERLSIGEAVDHLSAAVTRIKHEMTSETRHVVSAIVVASSNEVITLTHLIRRKQKN